MADVQETVYGLFSSGLREDLLRDVCVQDRGIQTGPFGSQLHQRDYVPIGTPIITVEHLGENRILHDDVPRVSDSDRDRLKRYKLKQGDIVFSRVGSVDRRALVRKAEEGWLFSGRCLRVRADADKIDPIFLSYFFGLETFKEHIRAIAVGATMPSLNTRLLSDVSIFYPPLEEQRAIADTLGSLDDKIEQNRHIAQTLEKMARVIFRAWFVDFEPVKAKAVGAVSFPSMPQPIFNALPTNFVDSQIGAIPEGWEVKDLNKCVHLTMGQSPPSEFYNESGEGLPFHQGVTDYGFRFPFHRVYCTVEGRLADPQDVLLSVRAPVGRINVADRRLILGRGLAGLRHRSDRQAYLLQQIFHVFAEEDTVGEGTIYKAVTKRFLEHLPLLSPPEQVQDEFDKLIRPLDQLIVECEVESGVLAKTRDLLLPKLMSGSVKVDYSQSRSPV